MIYLITNNVEYLFTYLFIWAFVSVKHLFMASLSHNPIFFCWIAGPSEMDLYSSCIPDTDFPPSVICTVNALSWFVSRGAMRWAGKGMFPQ